MAVVRVVEKLSVPTHLGVLRFERYADGDIIASLGGNHWFGIDGDDQGVIARFLGGGTADERPNGAVKPQIRKEARGWGVNVTASERYYYASRDDARQARSVHRIGDCARVG